MALTVEEAKEIIDRWKGWNHGQKSITLCMHGTRTVEDDILDERRKLILEAHRTLREHAEARS